MTESEAIEELKYDCNELGKAIPCDTSWGIAFENAYRMAIQALEEVQKYREIGSIEECRASREKQKIPKKPIYIANLGCTALWLCPVCERRIIRSDLVYCHQCGQKLDWSDEDERS
jgi:hypothetical protein